MTLKLLQGPITMVGNPLDDRISAVDAGYRQQQVFWLDEFGLIGRPKTNLGAVGGIGLTAMYICNTDGVMYVRKGATGLNLGGPFTYDYHTNKLLFWNAGINIPVAVEPLTGAHGQQESLGVTNASIRLPDRWLKLDNGAMEFAELDAVSNAFTAEHTFSPTLDNGTGTNHMISPGPGNTVFVWTSAASGEMVQYDWIKKEEVLPRRYIGSDLNNAMFYSRKYDIFIAVDDNALNSDIGELYIYANEFEPSALSAPVALTPVTQGRVSTIQSTLTDSDGNGIPDRRIDWTITVGNGTLSTTQSVTDENGIAEVDYRTELTGGVDPTIQAELTY